MKSALTSIQPYYVFLIIARVMGWKVEQEKTVEVRKNFPRAQDWDKKSLIYCSRNRRSFKRIPKEYQPLMAPLLGKVVGEFVCDRIDTIRDEGNGFVAGGVQASEWHSAAQTLIQAACLTEKELKAYLGNDYGYGWHISDLKIYDKPKELGEFTTPFCPYEVAKCKVGARLCKHYTFEDALGGECDYAHRITRPPQSYMFVEELP